MAFGICLTFLLQACGCATKDYPTESVVAGLPHFLVPKPDKIHFAFNSDALDAHAKEALTNTAEWMRQTRQQKVLLEGHSDERGTAEYNLVLGHKRASAARDYLRLKGIDPSNIITRSYGEDMPDDPRHTEEAWAKNRRVEIKGE